MMKFLRRFCVFKICKILPFYLSFILKFSGQMGSDRYLCSFVCYKVRRVLSQAARSWGLLVNIPGPGAATSNVKVSR